MRLRSSKSSSNDSTQEDLFQLQESAPRRQIPDEKKLERLFECLRQDKIYSSMSVPLLLKVPNDRQSEVYTRLLCLATLNRGSSALTQMTTIIKAAMDQQTPIYIDQVFETIVSLEHLPCKGDPIDLMARRFIHLSQYFYDDPESIDLYHQHTLPLVHSTSPGIKQKERMATLYSVIPLPSELVSTYETQMDLYDYEFVLSQPTWYAQLIPRLFELIRECPDHHTSHRILDCHMQPLRNYINRTPSFRYNVLDFYFSFLRESIPNYFSNTLEIARLLQYRNLMVHIGDIYPIILDHISRSLLFHRDYELLVQRDIAIDLYDGLSSSLEYIQKPDYIKIDPYFQCYLDTFEMIHRSDLIYRALERMRFHIHKKVLQEVAFLWTRLQTHVEYFHNVIKPGLSDPFYDFFDEKWIARLVISYI